MLTETYTDEHFGHLRVILGTDGTPLFCLTDVCHALGIANTTDVKRRLDPTYLETVEVRSTLTNRFGGSSTLYTKTTFIGEPNLCRCIFRSTKAEARAFQDWIFNDVLPRLRRTGSYSCADRRHPAPPTVTAPPPGWRQLYELGRAVTGRDSDITLGQLAKLLTAGGVPTGRIRLYRWMREHAYLFKRSREPRQEWVERGILALRETHIRTRYGWQVSVTPIVTGKGQAYFLSLFGVIGQTDGQTDGQTPYFPTEC